MPVVRQDVGPTFKLVIIEGPARGHSILIREDSFELGRQHLDPSNTAISRRHAVIRRRASDIWVEDISTNGIWVNHQRIHGEYMLSPGDHVRVGDSVLRLEM